MKFEKLLLLHEMENNGLRYLTPEKVLNQKAAIQSMGV